VLRYGVISHALQIATTTTLPNFTYVEPIIYLSVFVFWGEMEVGLSSSVGEAWIRVILVGRLLHCTSSALISRLQQQ
jgi:hypothetical protein